MGINTAHLPNGGITGGNYNGMILLQSPGGASIVSIPVGVTLADNALEQVNALSFSMPQNGKAPLPQSVTIQSSGTAYASAWELWHRGAGEVESGLSILAQLLAHAGGLYQENEAASARALREVGRG